MVNTPVGYTHTFFNSDNSDIYCTDGDAKVGTIVRPYRELSNERIKFTLIATKAI